MVKIILQQRKDVEFDSHLVNSVDTAEYDVLTTLKQRNIKSAWIGANKTIPNYGHYSTKGSSEISGATTLGTSLATRCKYKLHYGSVA